MDMSAVHVGILLGHRVEGEVKQATRSAAAAAAAAAQWPA